MPFNLASGLLLSSTGEALKEAGPGRGRKVIYYFFGRRGGRHRVKLWSLSFHLWTFIKTVWHSCVGRLSRKINGPVWIGLISKLDMRHGTLFHPEIVHVCKICRLLLVILSGSGGQKVNMIEVPFAMNISQPEYPFFTWGCVLTEGFFRMSPQLTDEYKTPLWTKGIQDSPKTRQPTLVSVSGTGVSTEIKHWVTGKRNTE